MLFLHTSEIPYDNVLTINEEWNMSISLISDFSISILTGFELSLPTSQIAKWIIVIAIANL